MLPNSGFFNRYYCPDSKIGSCVRPYCQYSHYTNSPVVIDNGPTSSAISNGNQVVIAESNGAISNTDSVPSYSTVPTEHFQGYHGYFASSSSPPPAVPKRPLLPTPSVTAPVLPVRPLQQVRPRPQQNVTSRKPAPSQQSSRSNFQKKPEGNLNTLARDLAAINNEIEKLQRKMANSSGQSVEGGDEVVNTDDDSAMDDVPGYDPAEPAAKKIRYSGNDFDSAGSANADSSSDELYRPKAATKVSSAAATLASAYKPTPIGELHKLGRPKNTLLKDAWSADSDAKLIKKTIPKEKAASTKLSALLEKKRNSKQASASDTSASVSDLFGDESDSESDMKTSTAERRGTFSKLSGSKSKDDPEDMASIIEDLIAPTSAMPQFPRKTTAQSGEDELSKKKKRVAELSNASLEATKKLREAGGERPKGHLMTPRQQLESRFAQLKKDQEELKAKQRELDDDLKKQKVVQPFASSADIGTNPKGEKRVARAPKPAEATKRLPGSQSMPRPLLPVEMGAKVPTTIRQQYLNMIIDEYLKSHSEQDAFQKALEEERAVYSKSATRAGYLNAIANAIKRVRDKESASSSSAAAPEIHSKKAPAAAISHNAVIGGKQATKYSYTVGRSGGGASSLVVDRRASNFSSEEFYEALLPFVISIDQQATNGYPRPDPERPGCAVYKKEDIKKMYVDDEELKRICIRCGTPFTLTPDGNYISRDECIFHWGRAWKKRSAGTVETRYNCCQEDTSSPGCSVSQYHVSDRMPRRALNGYAYTDEWSNGYQKVEPKAYALDCEMVYTTCGNELARVTVVNDQCQVVYERCVRPDNTILDYNTRFSGLTEDLLLNNPSAVSLEDVQHDMASMFTPDSILIGHSLESDFRALKLIHDKVVDTALVFPHRLGAPYKRALKTLAAEFLKKFIQDDVDGHDSKEDATTCMDLMKWRVKQNSGRGK